MSLPSAPDAYPQHLCGHTTFGGAVQVCVGTFPSSRHGLGPWFVLEGGAQLSWHSAEEQMPFLVCAFFDRHPISWHCHFPLWHSFSKWSMVAGKNLTLGNVCQDRKQKQRGRPHGQTHDLRSRQNTDSCHASLWLCWVEGSPPGLLQVMG